MEAKVKERERGRARVQWKSTVDKRMAGNGLTEEIMINRDG